MEEKLNPAIGHIGNALRSVAKDHITSFAEDIYDEHFHEYQAVINKLNSTQDEEGNLEKIPFKYIANEEFIFAIIDAEDKLLYGIQWDGTPVFGKTSAVEDRLQTQVNLLADKVTAILGDDDTTSAIDTLKELKDFFANIDNTQSLTSILANLNATIDKVAIKDESGEIQDSPFRVIENDEFIMSVVDSEDKILFGIYKATGKPYYPQNDMYHISHSEEFLWVILDTANHPLLGIQQDGTCWAAKAQWLDDIKSIKEALSSIDETLKTFQPKEDGKGLINLDVADSFFYISNDEYIIAAVDIEGRVLFGIYRESGKPYFPLNEMYHVIQNEEYFAAWITTDDKIVLGIRRDGEIIGEIHAVNALKQVVSTIQEKLDTIDSNLKEFLDIFSLQENPEYMAVETDADGKILSATKSDGSHYSRNLKSETIDAKVDKEEGKSLIDFNVAEAHSTFEDLEKRMEIVTDAEGNLLSERSAEGEKHEVKMNIDNLEVSNLNLQGNSVEDIKSALKSNGFYVAVDWSDSKDIQIPEPRCSCVNITNIKYMPTTKTQNLRAYFEFWDMQGNYFKKKVILNAQGKSSLAMPKKNFACDFCNDDWIGDDTFKIKFGSWVSQDSFHFKAFYADFFKGVSMVGYKLFNEIENTRKFSTNRIWKRALLPSNETIGYGTKGMSDITDINVLIDNGARCYPDGFPCIVYLNGEFYGVFSWALKKHRDNYMQNKSKAEHIQLDGAIYDTFTYNGTINWNVVNGIEATLNGGKDGFEFRNPKSLVCIDGTKYDADKNRKELIDSTSQLFNEKDKNHVLSNKVKGYYTQLTTYIPTLQSMKDGNEDSAAIKAKIQTYFDVDSLIDYLIFSDVVNNTDGFLKNWQWVTYDGIKWAVCPYDLDGILGWNGWNETSPNHEPFGDSLVLPTGWIRLYFHDELCQRYSELRKEILTVENIFGLLNDWCSRIGAANLKKDLNKWPQTPELYFHFKEEHTDNIYRVYNWIVQKLNKCDEYYSFNN